MKILVTRPAADAVPLAEALAARGHEVIAEPLLTVRDEPGAAAALDLALPGAQAILFTSANGVRAFAAAASRRDLPVFAVGDTTAAAARVAGFTAVESAQGDVEDLAALVQTRLKPANGPLLHAAASEVAGDLAGQLGAGGFEVRRVVVYRTEPAAELSEAAIDALASGNLAAALFFSPRTASTFVSLVEQAGLAASCRRVVAVALSAAVETVLTKLEWRRIVVAREPNQASFSEAIEALPDTEAARTLRDDTNMSDYRADNAPGETAGAANNSESDEPPAPKSASGIPPWLNRGGAARGATPSVRGPEPRGVRRRRWTWRIGVVLVLAALGLSAGIAAPYWMPFAIGTLPIALRGGANEAAELQALDTRLGALEARVTALDGKTDGLATLDQRLTVLEGRAAAAASPADAGAADTLNADAANTAGATDRQNLAMAALTDRIGVIEKRLAALSVGAPGGVSGSPAAGATISDLADQTQALKTALAGQQDRLAKLETAQATQPDRAGTALLIALEQLHTILATSHPFTNELNAAETLAKDQPDTLAELNKLDNKAATGIPSLSSLTERFEATATAIMRAVPPPATDRPWRERALAWAKQFFNVRRVDTPASDPADPDAAIASAETALQGSDLAGAATALQKLTGPMADAAKPWLDDAETRLDAERIMDTLAAAQIRRVFADRTQAEPQK